MKKAQITITVDRDALDEIRRFAEAEDRPLSNFINRLLKQEVEARADG